ncbi:MAG: hypothetical protein EPO23_03250 [Xanthobacteraceae bacterium]|nr:MAG: hypothetical protein EPO23_03250 [Xanthobacteraceae bacterium]
MASKYLQAAVDHYKALGTLSLEVPEWVVDGKPLTIFWDPMTLEESARFAKGDGGVLTFIDVIVAKALDSSGAKMFTIEDKPVLKRSVERAVLIRIGNAMLAAPSIEDAEKN